MALPSYESMRRALLVAIFIAETAPMLNMSLVIRRQSLATDTLFHVSLVGVALGFFLNPNPTLTTMLVVVLATMILEYLRTIYRTYSGISIAISMVGGLVLASVLMDLSRGNSAISIQSYLFDSVVTITWERIIFLGILLVAIGVLFFLFKRPMYVLTSDGDAARVDRLPVHLMSMMFNVITGVAIVVMIPTVSALLISAVVALPAVIGMRLGKSFNVVITISVYVGFLGVLLGLTSSFYLDTPPGVTITLVFIALFLIVNITKRILVAFRRKNN